MPNPENDLMRRRHSQIFIEDPPQTEVDLHGSWLAGFIERLTRVFRNISGKK
jgi:hypothetical protein